MKTLVRSAALLLMISVASAQVPRQAQFRFERMVQPGAAGPNRLDVDVTLLAGGKPFPPSVTAGPVLRGGLTDLRLFDATGREVPHLLIDPPPVANAWRTGIVLPVAATKETSGFEVDFAVGEPVDRIRVGGIPAPFLKRLTLEASGDRSRWTLLVAEGTLFDLPDEQLRRLDLEFVPGEYRYFRVTWNDTNTGRVPLPSRVEARYVNTAVTPAPLTMAVPFERRPSEPRRSRFRLQLPRGRLPIVMLQLDVEGSHMMRPAAVSEARFDGRQVQPNIIGRATLKRVTRDEIQADELRIPLSGHPHEAQLDLAVDDGDNPPLVIRSIAAIFAPLPTIYFESDGSPLVARYGDPNLDAPRYDLEAARPTVRLADAAVAQWSAAAPVSLTVDAPTLTTPLPSTGATMEPSLFTYSRALGSSAAGLTAVPLDAAVLSHSSGIDNHFSDLRILDTGGRQIPYIVERLDEPLTIETPLTSMVNPPEGLERIATRSWYRLDLPYEWLPNLRLTLRTSARVFRRQVQVIRPVTGAAPRQAAYSTIASHQWVHAHADLPAPPLVFNLPEGKPRELFVVVDEGDNKPLPLTSASLLLPAYRVRFFRPDAAQLHLVYGRTGLTPPEYDLALLAPQVLGAAATEITVAPESGDVVSEQVEVPLVPPMVFWAVLTLAIVVLLGIIVKLMRAEAPKAPESA